ncbi:hypothetical protein LNKW23_22760 [Paralimibaculum aggregatum]|uniref:DUF3592 domain-containing protein n=1 Tax=Paralimibaculum aggregatum TaxID=3036245 RepID=A0ABQ6LQ04_9RHOB|nr:hypothetical protein [Limibaculum sp. NKW23]GMG83063.1 hypothetical protein LNKW23_22760 [Limibaculum sp. NKW23]
MNAPAGGAARAGLWGAVALMILVPVLVTWMVWTVLGDPPPASLFWPSREGEVVDLRMTGTGSGGRNPDLVLELRFPDGDRAVVHTRDRMLARESDGRLIRDGEGAPQPMVARGDLVWVSLGRRGRATVEAPGDTIWLAAPITAIAVIVLAFGLRAALRLAAGRAL